MPFIPNGEMRINFSTGTQVKSAYSVQAQQTIQTPQIRLSLIEPNILKIASMSIKKSEVLSTQMQQEKINK